MQVKALFCAGVLREYGMCDMRELSLLNAMCKKRQILIYICNYIYAQRAHAGSRRIKILGQLALHKCKKNC